MNAGAHGRSIADVLKTARVFHLDQGLIEEYDSEGLAMSYRHTNLGAADVVTSASFKLDKGIASSIASSMEQYRAHRTATQPADAPNAGSMFTNPVEDSAGRLIESFGMKGHRVGNAEVSTKHANFFLAHPGATAQDIYDLMALVQASVEQASGVTLVPEIRIVGSFQREETLKRR